MVLYGVFKSHFEVVTYATFNIHSSQLRFVKSAWPTKHSTLIIFMALIHMLCNPLNCLMLVPVGDYSPPQDSNVKDLLNPSNPDHVHNLMSYVIYTISHLFNS